MSLAPASPSHPSAFQLDSQGGGLLCAQIANHYREEILRGVYPKGSHLPTCQQLAKTVGVAAQTVNRAFDILAKEGFVARRRSIGTVVIWGEGEMGGLSRFPRSPRQAVLPICQVARMASVTQENADLFMDYLNGFTEGFDAWKCRFEIAHLRETQSDLDMVRALVEHKQARGLVVMPLAKEAMEYLVEAKFPAVFLNADESLRGVTSVVADHVRGYSEAWSFVDSLGHREAAFFGFETKNFEQRYRECASGRALVEPSCQLGSFVKVPYAAGHEGIFSALVKAYGPWKKNAAGHKWPTVFFAQTDVMATRLMRALREQGIQVPSDISVIGFNDASIAKHWDPLLTTLAKPRFQMALAASRLLLDLLANRAAAQSALQTFPVRLVERESCARVRL